MTANRLKLSLFVVVLFLLLLGASSFFHVPNTQDISKALDTTVIDRFSLHESSVPEAAAIIMDHVYRQHPEMRKVQVILPDGSTLPAGPATPRPLLTANASLTIELQNIPANEALKYVTALSNNAYALRPGRIYLYPMGSPPPMTIRERLSAAIDSFWFRGWKLH